MVSSPGMPEMLSRCVGSTSAGLGDLSWRCTTARRGRSSSANKLHGLSESCKAERRAPQHLQQPGVWRAGRLRAVDEQWVMQQCTHEDRSSMQFSRVRLAGQRSKMVTRGGLCHVSSRPWKAGTKTLPTAGAMQPRRPGLCNRDRIGVILQRRAAASVVSYTLSYCRLRIYQVQLY